MREWEPMFVGLLNVLSCRRKDDIPTQLPVDGAHTRESVIGDCDRRHHDRCECAVDHRGKHKEGSRAGYKCERKSSRNSTLTAILCQCRSVCNQRAKGNSKHGKDRIKSSEKVKDDDQRKCHYCRKAGHTKSQSSTRLKDLADAEEKPVTANS